MTAGEVESRKSKVEGFCLAVIARCFSAFDLRPSIFDLPPNARARH